MRGHQPHSARAHCAPGLTLIELLITLAIVVLVAAVALPSYQSSVRKSRRSEGITALSNVQQLQERHRSTQPKYAASLTDARDAKPPGLGMGSVRTASGYYDLSAALIGTGELGYVLTAVAVSGSTQASDADCRVLAARMESGNVRYAGASSASGINWALANPDPSRCWAR